MTTETIILVLLIATALAFDFTNGFHDTGNAMATSIATGALPPRVAVALSGVLNLVGAFLSLAVAATIASGLVDTDVVTLQVVAAGLAGGITWNLLTWYFGIPSSSSHALIGGYAGAAVARVGVRAIVPGRPWVKTLSFIVLSPLIGMVLGFLLMVAVSWTFHKAPYGSVDRRVRRAPLCPRSAFSLFPGHTD